MGVRARFDQMSVLTLRIWKDRPEQTVDSDQTPENAASDLGPHCLPLILQFCTESYSQVIKWT